MEYWVGTGYRGIKQENWGIEKPGLINQEKLWWIESNGIIEHENWIGGGGSEKDFGGIKQEKLGYWEGVKEWKGLEKWNSRSWNI